MTSVPAGLRSKFIPGAAGLLAGAVVLALLGSVLPSYYVGLLTEALILGIFAMSLDLLLGYTGLPSLGHAAYFGAGAYGVAILSVKLGLAWWWAAIGGAAFGVFAAAVFGVLALRTSGVFFLMITLALAQVLWAIAFGWRAVTGGDDGLPGVARPDLGFAGVSLGTAANYYYAVLAIFLVSSLAMLVLTMSPIGYALRGIRDNERRMQALGYNVWLTKYIVFVISGGFAALAGILMAYHKKFVSPEVLSVALSAEALLMVILGGAGTLFGSVVGAMAIVFLSNVISAYSDRWVLILGVIYVLVVIFAPAGIIGELRAKLRERARVQ